MYSHQPTRFVRPPLNNTDHNQTIIVDMHSDSVPSNRSIWRDANGIVTVLDQQTLPHHIQAVQLLTLDDAAAAIRDMTVRGAPLIGVTAGYGMWLAAAEIPDDQDFEEGMKAAAATLHATRPTAVNLAWALERQLEVVRRSVNRAEAIAELAREADVITEEDVAMCRSIGQHGLELITEIAHRKNGERVNILTHCNAGRLACVEYGTATSPMYHAHNAGIDIHVWVDETRPRLQGGKLTAFELGQAGVPHTVIPDNAAGHIMQRGMVDLAIVGCDRLTRNGDACNKIGTYTKGLAAHTNNVPFYVALPSSTIDWRIADWRDIPIEERSDDEVRYVHGMSDGELRSVEIIPSDSPALNFGFDVTPASYVTGIITERGVCNATEEALIELFGEEISSV